MRRICVILTLLMLLSLAGCGQAGPELPEPDGGSAAAEASGTAEPEEALRLSVEALPGGMSELLAVQVSGGRLSFAGCAGDGSPRLGTLDASGGCSLAELPTDIDKVLAPCFDGEALKALALRDGRLCLLACSGGGEPAVTALTGEALEGLGSNLEYCEYGGMGYIRASDRVVELSASGETGRSALLEHDYGYLCALQPCSGRLCLLAWNPIYRLGTLFELDREAMVLLPLETGGLNVTAIGLDSDGGLLLGGELEGRECVCRLGEDGPEPLFYWDEPGVVSPSYTHLARLGDGGALLCCYRGMDMLESLSVEAAAPKLRLTLLAEHRLLELPDIVNAFNRESEDCSISIRYMDEEGLTPERLQAELTAGDGPDIFAFEDRSRLGLGGSALEDLLPRLDADPEYSRDTLVPSLLQAMCAEGGLFWLPKAFSISTFTAPSTCISGPGVSYEDAKAAADALGLPLFPGWMTRDTLWGWLSRFAVGQFVDLEAGVCSFDSEDYIALLEQCAAAAPELSDDYASLYSGLLQFEQLQNFIRLAAISQNYGGAYVFAGAPNDTTNGSMFTPGLSFAISARSEHGDAAWQFVRSVLDEQNQGLTDLAFPSSAAVLDAQLDVMSGPGLDFYGTVYRLSEDDVRKFRELLEGTSTLSDLLPAVTGIMEEDAAQFFSGQIPASQAAAYTQDRVSLYLAERS